MEFWQEYLTAIPDMVIASRIKSTRALSFDIIGWSLIYGFAKNTLYENSTQ
jgi:hypothetical protein